MNIQSTLSKYYQWQKKIQLASSIRSVVANDKNNRMPPAAVQTRADQLAHINRHIHELSTDEEYILLVESLIPHIDTFSPKDKRSIQFAWGGIQYNQSIPDEFIERFDTAKSLSLDARHEAKKANDWGVLAPALQQSFDHAKEYASLYNASLDPFDVRCDYGEFTMNASKYEEIFGSVSCVCVEVMQAKQGTLQDMQWYIEDFDRTTLYFLIRELLSQIGFDFDQGVLSTIRRPYSENCGPYDERIHIANDKPLLETILAAVHECGHGLTDMHINPSYHWTNLHRSLPMGIHESQARGLENIIGRSMPFCIYLTGLLKKYFPSLRHRNAQALYDYLNNVHPSVIRTSADEASYNLHIYIRYRIEQEVFHNQTTIQQIPQRRNELYQEHLGVVPHDHRQGCLQDQHWSLGLFGYFPTYTLGNIIAAQLWEKFTALHPNRGDLIAVGNFSEYFTRYKENIRHHGNMFTTHELLVQATGKPLDVNCFVGYLTKKYL